MREALNDIAETARGLARNGRALVLFFVTYFALLATLTLFILTREATIKDVLVSMAMLIVVPALFFLLQAMCVTYEVTVGAREVLKESVRILRRVFIVSIPFILLGFAMFMILGRIDARFSPSIQGQTLATLAREGETWPRVVLSTIRLVMFGIVFPLACIHMWIAVRAQDLQKVLRTIKPILSKAFALRSIETYVIGFGLFGILPYLLIIVRTPSERAWLEITLLSVRVLVALSLMLFGWVLTVGALQRGTTTSRTKDE